jgi:SAM-dependent methyltransferase
MSYVERFTLLKKTCEGKRVLHLGATDYPVTESAIATNRFLHTHLCEVADMVVGLDLAETAIEMLRSKHGITNIRPGNIERPEDYPAGPFDYVVAGEIFEHLNNPGLALSAVSRCLAGKGALVITVPNAYSLKGFCRAACGHEWIHPDHVLHHSASTLNTLLNRHGFVPIKWFGYTNGGSGALAALANTILRFRPQLAEGIGVIAEPIHP